MSMVVLELPDVKSEADGRPQLCSNCKEETFLRWGGRMRKIRDPRVRYVMVDRYQCCECKHTFRHYPPEVDEVQQSLRLRRLAALMWVLGLSYWRVAAVLVVFGAGIGRMKMRTRTLRGYKTRSRLMAAGSGMC